MRAINMNRVRLNEKIRINFQNLYTPTFDSINLLLSHASFDFCMSCNIYSKFHYSLLSRLSILQEKTKANDAGFLIETTIWPGYARP